MAEHLALRLVLLALLALDLAPNRALLLLALEALALLLLLETALLRGLAKGGSQSATSSEYQDNTQGFSRRSCSRIAQPSRSAPASRVPNTPQNAPQDPEHFPKRHKHPKALPQTPYTP